MIFLFQVLRQALFIPVMAPRLAHPHTMQQDIFRHASISRTYPPIFSESCDQQLSDFDLEWLRCQEGTSIPQRDYLESRFQTPCKTWQVYKKVGWTAKLSSTALVSTFKNFDNLVILLRLPPQNFRYKNCTKVNLDLVLRTKLYKMHLDDCFKTFTSMPECTDNLILRFFIGPR